jgi:hypothetical protein
MPSSYDIWKTNDPNDGDVELLEKLEEEYWADLDWVAKDVVAFVSELVSYHILFPDSQGFLGDDSLFHHVMKEFKEYCVPDILERMLEHIKYES